MQRTLHPNTQLYLVHKPKKMNLEQELTLQPLPSPKSQAAATRHFGSLAATRQLLGSAQLAATSAQLGSANFGKATSSGSGNFGIHLWVQLRQATLRQRRASNFETETREWERERHLKVRERKLWWRSSTSNMYPPSELTNSARSHLLTHARSPLDSTDWTHETLVGLAASMGVSWTCGERTC